jgi:sphinganine-1-phosphate aldolase
MNLPTHGMGRDAVLARLATFRKGDLPWRDGRAFAYVYQAGQEAEAVAKEAYMAFLGENALDPTVFPSLLRMENEVVGICARHLGGGPDAVGSFTSGGTESIMLAVKAARERFVATRGPALRPQIVVPSTAHAAFHKAAHYLGLECVVVGVDQRTFKADPAAMAAAITERTALIVGSAPSYAHGVIDPIEALGQLALDRGVLLHVDACVGGFLLPYWRRLGVDVPAFDLSVPGVTSVSMDLHKYGFAPKGASVVVYPTPELRRHQIFACGSWTGYTIINPNVQSTRSGGPIAGAWAVLHFLGDDGYLAIAEDTLTSTRRLVAGLDAIDGLDVLGSPEFCVLSAASRDVDVFHVIDAMRERGWYVQPQLSHDDSPANIHFSLQPGNTRTLDPMLADLALAVADARTRPKSTLGAQVRAMLAGAAGMELTPAVFERLLGAAGIRGTELPERMADINAILDALPRELSEQLLIEFVNRLYAQPLEDSA